MGPAKLILVVEDNALGHELMQAMLEEAGFRVACAANGKEALDVLCGPERPCLVLLDLHMPVVDGREFLAVQRQAAHLASVPAPRTTERSECQGLTSAPRRKAPERGRQPRDRAAAGSTPGGRGSGGA